MNANDLIDQLRGLRLEELLAHLEEIDRERRAVRILIRLAHAGCSRSLPKREEGLKQAPKKK